MREMVVLDRPRKVLLADDHVVLRRTVRDLIDMSGDFVVVNEVANGDDAILALDDAEIDIVLMDVNMPGIGGIEATRRIKRWHPNVEVIALSATGDIELVQEMIDAGAAGYVVKGGPSEELIRSLRTVADGKGVLDDTVTRDVFNQMSHLYREEQARVNELQELNKMKTEFMSVISHELQTPLAIIKAGIHLLHNHGDTVDENTKDVFFLSLAEETDKLGHVVEQMLTVAAIQNGSVSDASQVITLEEVAAEARATFVAGEGIERMRLEVRDANVLVRADRERLVKAVRSLVDNALRFSEDEVTVVIERDGEWGSLTVSDRGPGLDTDLKERVLREPFVQADSSNTREHGGLGLSLYIANGVLEACGGRFEIGDPPGGSLKMLLPTAGGSVRRIKFG